MLLIQAKFPLQTVLLVGAAEVLAGFDMISDYAAHSTRMRSKSNFARPYMLRLMNLSRFTAPSTGPWLQCKLNPARTAASSRSSPLAKLTSSALALAWVFLSQLIGHGQLSVALTQEDDLGLLLRIQALRRQVKPPANL